MKRRYLILVVVALLLLMVAGLFWLGRPARGMPMYQGKSGQYWLGEVFTTNQSVVFAAFREFGTNGVPVFLWAFEQRDTAGSKLYRRIYPRLPPALQDRLARPMSAEAIWVSAELLVLNNAYAQAALPDFVRMLEEPKNPARPYLLPCVFHLAKTGDTNCLPVYIQCLQDGNGSFRLSAAVALQKMGPEAIAALPALTNAMNDTVAAVRVQAARAVWKVSGETNAAVKVLKRTGFDPDRESAAWARIYLSEMQPENKSLIPIIAELVEDRNAGIQMSATSVIGRYGPDAKVAVPALVRLMETNSASAELKARALNSLKRIDPGTAAAYEKK